MAQIELAQAETDRITAEQVEAARLRNIEISENQARAILNDCKNYAHMSREQLERESQMLNSLPTSFVLKSKIEMIECRLQGL